MKTSCLEKDLPQLWSGTSHAGPSLALPDSSGSNGLYMVSTFGVNSDIRRSVLGCSRIPLCHEGWSENVIFRYRTNGAHMRELITVEPASLKGGPRLLLTSSSTHTIKTIYTKLLRETRTDTWDNFFPAVK